MPVIINDFEIQVEPPASLGGQQGDTRQQEGQAAPTPPLRPQDIEQVIKHFQQRRQRLIAD